MEYAQENLERARNQLLLSIYQQCEDNASLASLMGEYIASVGDPTFAFELLKRVERASAQDVVRVAKKYFQPHRRTRVTGYPQVESDHRLEGSEGPTAQVETEAES